MGYALDVVFVLICLAMIIGGVHLMIHFHGVNEHSKTCRTCRIFRAVLREH